MTTAVEIVLFDGWDEMDALAPYEVLRQAARRGADLSCTLVTLQGARPVVGANGLTVQSTGTLGQPDWLIVPGGGWGDRAERGAFGEARRGELPKAIAAAHARGGGIASVCTGALLVASAGLLQGRPAVTHHGALGDLARAGAQVVKARVVDDGELVTAGGVTSGLDLGLHLLERIAGRAVAEAVSVEMEVVRGQVYLGPRAMPAGDA
jgi:transcriptional regulator GlxA family with amidase domain